MALLQGKFIADDAIQGDKVKLNNDQYLRGRNNADSADVDLVKVNASDEIEFASRPVVGGDSLAYLSDIPGVFDVQGNWDASTNTPSLASGVNGTSATNPLYIVNVAGSTTLDGISSWDVGDWVYFANGAWQKADNVDDVLSVNSQTGAVVLDTDDISEGTTNLYFTESRVEDTTLANYTVGADAAIANTDDVKGAFGKVQGQINALSSAATLADNVSLSINATDISNGYKDLAQEATTVLSVTPKGGLKQEVGVDYTLSVVSSVTRITFAGDLATVLADGDTLLVSYLY